MKNIVLRDFLTFLLLSVLLSTHAIQHVSSNHELKRASTLEVTLEPGSPIYSPAEIAEVHGTASFHTIPLPDIQVTITVLDPSESIK